MKKIGFIGCGNMGFAIAFALSKNQNNKITIFTPHYEKAKELALTIQATAVKNIEEVFSSSEIIILAVKPQIMPSLYNKIKNINNNSIEKNKIFISLAAGITISTLQNNTNKKEFVRFMPNIGAKFGKSVTAVAFSEKFNEQNKNIILEIAQSFGEAFVLEEKLFSAFIGLSGSGIAYILEFLHALALGGTREGISYTQSLKIALSTLNSASALLQNNENPIAQQTKVLSAGGTTIEGVNALHQGNFDATVIDAIHKSSEKSQKLEQKA